MGIFMTQWIWGICEVVRKSMRGDVTYCQKFKYKGPDDKLDLHKVGKIPKRVHLIVFPTRNPFMLILS